MGKYQETTKRNGIVVMPGIKICRKCDKPTYERTTYCYFCDWHVFYTRHPKYPLTLSLFRADGSPSIWSDLSKYDRSYRAGIAYATKLTRIQRAKEKTVKRRQNEPN